MNLEELIQKAKSFEFDEDDIKKDKTGRELFVKRFPLENLKNMTLQEYTGHNDSFCYWLEFKKNIPFGIGGGNASKFGIYRASDGNYYKHIKGKKFLLETEELENEYLDLKNKILSIIELVQKDEIDKISEIEIPVWNMVIIKILFLYFPDKFLDFAAPWALIPMVKNINLKIDKEINNKNVLLLNYHLGKFLCSVEPFKSWDKSHLGDFLWKVYKCEELKNEKKDEEENYSVETNKKGPKFLKFYKPIIELLRDLGGEAKSNIILDEITKNMKIPSLELEEKTKTGVPKIYNQIHWARMYLVNGDYLDNSIRGLWKLTEKGKNVNLDDIDVLTEFKKVQKKYTAKIDEDEEPLEHYDESDLPVTDQPQYWIIAPGQKARLWQDFIGNAICAIGWDELGDLSKYNSLEDIKVKMKEIYGDDSSFVNNGLACYEFLKEIKIGDFIFAKKGVKKIIGFGIIESDFYYDEQRNEYKNCRKVKWLKTGEWKSKDQLALKTLTNITKYTEFLQRLKNLVDLPIQSNESTNTETNFWWLNANPKIWTFRDMNVGAINDYKSFTDKGTKARIFKNFQNVQVKDKILGYITSPENIVDGICEVTDIFKENNEIVKFEFKKIEEFKKPVTWNELKSNNELLNCEPMKNNQGSLFKLTKEEYDIIMEMVHKKPPVVLEKYTIDDALIELFIEQSELEEIISTLKYKKNIILQGAPGVGKTFVAKRIAYLMMEEKDESRVQMIQFHQSYSYEDFIQGYRPTDNGGFEIKNGVFYEFCKKAQWDRDNDYFFIIDEINRGNLSKIFGELMMLIEKDKRGKNFAIPLTYSKNEDEIFYLPKNLYFIGTMNTADRSLAMVDYALRRRFGFITLEPAFAKPKFKKFLYDCNVTENIVEMIIDKMISLNEKIASDNKNLGMGYRIGHSFFCPGKDIVPDPDWRWYEEVVKSEIAPLLREYWFDSIELVDDEIKKLVQL